MSKWIEFEELGTSKSGKTKIWVVYSKKDEVPFSDLWIGQVKWMSSWRKYAFFPEQDTVYEQDCLRDLAQFCEDQNKAHKEAKK